MIDIYSPGQVKMIFPYWPKKAEWFVLGGPGTGNEGQVVKQNFPDVHCIAFEPHPLLRSQQRELGFPGEVHPWALWNERISQTLLDVRPNILASSICRDFGPQQSNYKKINVACRTLDDLSEDFGPFTNCVLWLDIEQAEYRALQGAKNLLASGNIKLINVEIFTPNLYQPIIDLLIPHGFQEVLKWDNSIGEKWDYVFKKVTH